MFCWHLLSARLLAHRLPGYLRQGRHGSLSLAADRAAAPAQGQRSCWRLSNPHRGHHGHLLDIWGSICTFMRRWHSSTWPQKRSEVETELGNSSRRRAGLSAVAGVAGALPISDNGLGRGGMFELWIQRLNQACQEAVSSRANMAQKAADLLLPRSTARDCCD